MLTNIFEKNIEEVGGYRTLVASAQGRGSAGSVAVELKSSSGEAPRRRLDIRGSSPPRRSLRAMAREEPWLVAREAAEGCAREANNGGRRAGRPVAGGGFGGQDREEEDGSARVHVVRLAGYCWVLPEHI